MDQLLSTDDIDPSLLQALEDTSLDPTPAPSKASSYRPPEQGGEWTSKATGTFLWGGGTGNAARDQIFAAALVAAAKEEGGESDLAAALALIQKQQQREAAQAAQLARSQEDAGQPGQSKSEGEKDPSSAGRAQAGQRRTPPPAPPVPEWWNTFVQAVRMKFSGPSMPGVMGAESQRGPQIADAVHESLPGWREFELGMQSGAVDALGQKAVPSPEAVALAGARRKENAAPENANLTQQQLIQQLYGMQIAAAHNLAGNAAQPVAPQAQWDLAAAARNAISNPQLSMPGMSSPDAAAAAAAAAIYRNAGLAAGGQYNLQNANLAGLTARTPPPQAGSSAAAANAAYLSAYAAALAAQQNPANAYLQRLYGAAGVPGVGQGRAQRSLLQDYAHDRQRLLEELKYAVLQAEIVRRSIAECWSENRRVRDQIRAYASAIAHDAAMLQAVKAQYYRAAEIAHNLREISAKLADELAQNFVGLD
eukprot:tig00022075_g23623.t1